eukprot:TRINITY_DN21146_c0_g1_i3.p1 TRINITY_DN21146_c0_g1~~TRINITY_DN21146_c0_g1_i3.p1  ORF type:complete len:716 (+),score=132.48 TRINITY_DN21146_c0_g1_i3:57-2204(+)
MMVAAGPASCWDPQRKSNVQSSASVAISEQAVGRTQVEVAGDLLDALKQTLTCGIQVSLNLSEVNCGTHVGFHSNAKVIVTLLHLVVQLALFPRPQVVDEDASCRFANDVQTQTEAQPAAPLTKKSIQLANCGATLGGIASKPAKGRTRLGMAPFHRLAARGPPGDAVAAASVGSLRPPNSRGSDADVCRCEEEEEKEEIEERDDGLIASTENEAPGDMPATRTSPEERVAVDTLASHGSSVASTVVMSPAAAFAVRLLTGARAESAPSSTSSSTAVPALASPKVSSSQPRRAAPAPVQVSSSSSSSSSFYATAATVASATPAVAVTTGNPMDTTVAHSVRETTSLTSISSSFPKASSLPSATMPFVPAVAAASAPSVAAGGAFSEANPVDGDGAVSTVECIESPAAQTTACPSSTDNATSRATASPPKCASSVASSPSTAHGVAPSVAASPVAQTVPSRVEAGGTVSTDERHGDLHSLTSAEKRESSPEPTCDRTVPGIAAITVMRRPKALPEDGFYAACEDANSGIDDATAAATSSLNLLSSQASRHRTSSRPSSARAGPWNREERAPASVSIVSLGAPGRGLEVNGAGGGFPGVAGVSFGTFGGSGGGFAIDRPAAGSGAAAAAVGVRKRPWSAGACPPGPAPLIGGVLGAGGGGGGCCGASAGVGGGGNVTNTNGANTWSSPLAAASGGNVIGSSGLRSSSRPQSASACRR